MSVKLLVVLVILFTIMSVSIAMIYTIDANDSIGRTLDNTFFLTIICGGAWTVLALLFSSIVKKV
jgi:tryptophan-rich sensory protein